MEAFRDFVARDRHPGRRTLKGLGALPTDDPLFLGMLGMHGTRAANHAVQESRPADRASARASTTAPPASSTGSRPTRGSSTSTSTRPRSASCAVPTSRCAGDLRNPSLRSAQRACASAPGARHCLRMKARARVALRRARRRRLRARAAAAPVRAAATARPIVACDVGQHQMWVAQHCRFAGPSAT